MQIDPIAAGLDEARLANIDDHLERRYVAPGKIAGCQVAVWRRGHLGYLRNFGNRDRERAVPVTDDTIWRLYSMTKPVTGVALMTLYERGHFQLDDPVDRWIPEWKGMQVAERTADGGTRLVPADRPPTVRHLLTHTAGIGYGRDNSDLDLAWVTGSGGTRWDKGMDLEQFAKAIGTWPLRYQPGTRWMYSFGMDIAGRLIEVMSGMAFDDYLRSEIFGPLGMVDTDFFVPESEMGRLAALYARNARKELVLVDDPETSKRRYKSTLLLGGSGLLGTMGDYVRFAAMLANGGELDGTRILSRKTVDLMGANHLPGNADIGDLRLEDSYIELGGPGIGFGLTMSVDKDPVTVGIVGSGGEMAWGGAASTRFWVDRTEELAVVFMTQLMPSATFNFDGQLRTLVYGAIAD